jgi:DNA-binding NarL/FixJ family response regulator
MESVKVLLADDHALVRAGLRDALNNVPCLQVIGEVGNGRELVKALRQYQPDLLVVDVQMPDFEPVEDTRQIRSEHPQMKILVVSAYDDQAYVVGMLSAGMDGYHLKDQPLADLLLAVQRILDGGRWISDPLVNRLVDHSISHSVPETTITRRQRELLYLLTQGYNNQKIARVMEISNKTVENHLTALYRAIGVNSRLEANHYANRHPELLYVPGQEKNLGRGESLKVGTLTVLVVDDNPRYRTQLGRLVGKTCPTSYVYEAEDTVEAYRLAEQIKPNLAFIDVVLREDDGIQCVKRLKTISPSTRIVLISAYPDREFRRLGMSAGSVAFLDKKDIDSATVRQVVEDTLESLAKQ